LTATLKSPGDVTSRKTFSGHVTCSGYVVSPGGRVLHIRHNVLNRWLQPGGHLEPDDPDLVAAAVREVTEETGIPAGALTLADAVPVDIDVHPIPANDAKSEPDHQHFDVGYAFTVEDVLPVMLQVDEVHDAAWLPIAEIHPEALRTKLVAVTGMRAATSHQA
jgi:8-oxo-dGTP pyrophosphatase MutT (NUDIX family)